MTDSIVRNSSPTASVANLVSVVHDYSATRRVEHVLHPVLNSSSFTVTYRPVRLRAGRLSLLFATAAHAKAAVDLLVTGYTFTLTADVTQASMTFVVAPGDLNPQPDPEGTDAWVVEVPFQEVS
jgi:hypothetical protein